MTEPIETVARLRELADYIERQTPRKVMDDNDPRLSGWIVRDAPDYLRRIADQFERGLTLSGDVGAGSRCLLSDRSPRMSEIPRWALREVDSDGDEPVYDGMETSSDGGWVMWEDVKRFLAPPSGGTPVPSEAAIEAAVLAYLQAVTAEVDAGGEVNRESRPRFMRTALEAGYAVDRPAVPGEPSTMKDEVMPSESRGLQADRQSRVPPQPPADDTAMHENVSGIPVDPEGRGSVNNAPDHAGLLRELRQAVGKWGALMWSDGEASKSPADPWSDETNAAWARLDTLLSHVTQALEGKGA